MSAISIEQIEETLNANYPLLANDLPTLQKFVSKLETYSRELGPPSLEKASQWASEFEGQLRQQTDTKDAEVREHRTSRRQERLDYLAGSDQDKAEMVRDHVARQAKREEIVPFKPEREFTPEEIERMSSAEYKTRVLGVDSIPLNESKPDAVIEEHNRQRILKSRKNDPLSAAIRRELRRELAK